MKLKYRTLAISLLVILSACGEQEQPTPAAAEGTPAAASRFREAVDRAAEAVRQAPQLAVAVDTTFRAGADTRTGRQTMLIGPGDAFDWSGPGFRMAVVDGRLRAEVDAVEDRIVDVPREGALVYQVEDVLTMSPPPALLVMRSGAAAEIWLDSLTSGLLPGVRVTDVVDTGTGGQVVHLGSGAGGQGAGTLSLDADGMPTRVQVDSVMAAGHEPVDVYYEVVIEQITAAEHLPPLEVGDRQVVPDVPSLTATASTQTPMIGPGDEAPEFSLPSTDGTTVTLSSLRGRCVVLDFWATWCAPCKQGLPELERVYQETGRGTASVLVYGVNVLDGGSIDKVNAFWKTQPVTFPSLVDTTGTMPQRWGMQGIPVTLVVGPDGIVRSRIDGYQPGEWKHIVEAAREACAGEE